MRATVLGAVGIDTNVYLPSGGIDWEVETNFTPNLDVVGQAGAYSARGLAALGFEVTLVGAIGEDPAGRWVREQVEAWGIDTVWLLDPVRTHRSVNLVATDGSRKNFYDAGGSEHVALGDIAGTAFPAPTAVAHFHLEDWCRHLLVPAREAGAVVSCDLQDIERLDDAYRGDFIKHADLLFFSTVNQADPGAAAMHLLDVGRARMVVAALGAEGALVATHEGIVVSGPREMAAPVVDTNGAGDSLAAGVLWATMMQDWGPPRALAAGQVAARWICGQTAAHKDPITATALTAHLDGVAAPPNT